METTLKVTVVLSLLSVSLLGVWSGTRKDVDFKSPTCYHYECPTYDVIDDGDGYEIRRYNSPVWISNPPIQDNSLVLATTTGLNRLFAYINGNNNYKQKIERTAPVITEVFSKSSFGVSLFVPKENQANPPPAKDLNVQRWKTVYAAVGQYNGDVIDTEIGNQVASLNVSIAGTKWSAAIEKSHGAGHASIYTVAQYKSPYDIDNYRITEIWFLFDIENVPPHSM